MFNPAEVNKRDVGILIDQLMAENAPLMKIAVIMQQGVALPHSIYSNLISYHSLNLGNTRYFYMLLTQVGASYNR